MKNKKNIQLDNLRLFQKWSLLALKGLKSQNAQGCKLGTRWSIDKHPLDDKTVLTFRGKR